jgi:hypothetical protein
MKKAVHKTGGGSKRVLATKKGSANGQPKSAPLKFKLISEAELKSSRNSAYGYLVK